MDEEKLNLIKVIKDIFIREIHNEKVLYNYYVYAFNMYFGRVYLSCI